MTDPFASDPLDYEEPEPAVATRPAPWLDSLNESQREAVDALIRLDRSAQVPGALSNDDSFSVRAAAARAQIRAC